MAARKPKTFNPFPPPPPKPLKFGPVTDAADRAAARKENRKKIKTLTKNRDVAKAKAAAPKPTPKVKAKTAAKNAAKAQQLSKAKNWVTTQRLKNIGTSSPKAPSSSVSAAPARTGPNSGSASGTRSLYNRLTGGGLSKHGR